MKKKVKTIKSNFLKKLSQEGINYGTLKLGGGYINQVYLVQTKKKKKKRNMFLNFINLKKKQKRQLKTMNL